MMRKIWLFFLSALPVLIVCTIVLKYTSETEAKAEKSSTSSASGRTVRYISPTPGEFPIVASTVFYSKIGPNKEGLRGVEECGFNLCMDAATIEQFDTMLKCMEGMRLKALLYNYVFNSSDYKKSDWRERIIDFVNRFKNHPNVAGWKFGDEPQWDKLEEWRQRYDLLQATDPDHFISLNFVGELNSNYTGPCKTLDVYLDSVQNVFKLGVWSSDYYPIIIRNNNFSVNYAGFYKDLEAYAKKAKQTGVPMWTYCESMEYVSKNHRRPAATVPYLTFEAFSALAYGSQGIVYWTYWMRPSPPKTEYVGALVDSVGNKLPAWYAAQKVNREIRGYTPVFLGAKFMECQHTGNIGYKDTRAMIRDFGPIERLTSGEKGVLVSYLRNTGKNYIVIVNHDVEKTQQINLTFNKNAKVKLLKLSSSGEIERNNVSLHFNPVIDAGSYMIFEW